MARWFLRRRFLTFDNVFKLFLNYLPLEKGVVLYLKNKLNPLHPRMLCVKFGWNWPSDFWEEDFFFVIDFHCFIIIFLRKMAWPFIWTNWIPLHPRMLCAKFGWHCLQTDGRTTVDRWSDKRPTGLNGHLGIRDCTDFLSDRLKGSDWVPFRPGEKIRKFEMLLIIWSQCVLQCIHVKLYHEKNTNVQNWILIKLQPFFQNGGIVFTLKFHWD